MAALVGKVTRFTLSNGLRFLVVPWGSAPLFAGVVSVRAGSVNEHAGITGLAHLMEHMAFKGTDAIGVKDPLAEAPLMSRIDAVGRALSLEEVKGERADRARIATLRNEIAALEREHQALEVESEFARTYHEHGGRALNATTSPDLVRYFVTLPANQLELWMLMESERLAHPVLREFYIERDVVAEERRMRVDTHPEGLLREEMLATAFHAHPYGQPSVGWMSDLMAVTREEAQTFHRLYYVPSSVVAVLVGAVDPARVHVLAQKYFGAIPAGPAAPSVRTVEPPQTGERRVLVTMDAAPRVMVAWHKPCPPHREDVVLQLIAAILNAGGGPLQRRLVTQGHLASSVSVDAKVPGELYPNLLVVRANPLPGHSVKDVEAVIEDVCDGLGRLPLPQEALDAARRALTMTQLRLMESPLLLARLLAHAETVAGDYTYLEWMQRTLDSVTPAQVQSVAAAVFTARNRTVAALLGSTGASRARPEPSAPVGDEGEADDEASP